ncbi:hypothetical protein LPC08_16490 [Roseomonas sp. OT10]|uniref:hypothetical protein n=1 Tax=Roseomonas cutis TaxID=2897332 RepID=UPI001E353AE6|nr:hypothetical protein [Roseomonas sp. OT10]UFN47605.1 hypothetical protein LPC08_16490 [Roseomonas sp. OT10]
MARHAAAAEAPWSGSRVALIERELNLRKPNYNQERLQRERDKAAKAQAKEQRKQALKAAEDAPREAEDKLPEPLDPAIKG